jgi:hypothetical protein
MTSDVFFYESSDGYSEYYKTNQGNIDWQRGDTSLGAGWTHIVQGQFAGAGLC